MLFLIRTTVEWFSRIGDVWAVIQWLSPAFAIMAMSTLAYLQGQPLVGILFVGLVSAATTLIIVSEVRKMLRENSVYRYLGVRKFEPMDGEIQTQSKTMYATVGCILENNSDRPLYFKVRRADLALQGRINQEAITGSVITDIPPKSHRYLRFATITGIDATRKIDGKVELEIFYGPSTTALKYLFQYQGIPTLIYRWDGKKDEGELQVRILSEIVRVDHSKAKMR